MTVTPEMLLDGPRGRRLCLNLALELMPALWQPVMQCGGALDPAMGTGRVHLTLMVPDDDAGRPLDDGPWKPGDVARLLRSCDPGGVTERLIGRAFDASVSVARGWQEPEGEDFLAALPEIREALIPLARAVLATAAGASYDALRQAEQWHLDWRVPEDPVRLPSSPRPQLAAWAAATRAEEERAHHDRPRDPRAPYSGTWWSHPERLLQTVGHIPSSFDRVEDLPWEEFMTAVPIRGTGRTYEIAAEEDWAALCRDFPLDVTASRRHSWFSVTGRDGDWVIPDWESVASVWDAVHLSSLAYLRCATRSITVDDARASVIAGWNPDTTIWLTDVARERVEPRQSWRRSRASDEWERTA
ncbi:Uncharacterised protein [Arthrobacter agilis]|uniref:hypothetical protein n=1 Tax=Arthrobacter agilis TaxID=37921 RepID=UPI000F6C2E86|nr:hypothetical protein [Arthrobacter agilis]VDR33475.1 Uncharacterised protein [Arthrobacter agilis]